MRFPTCGFELFSYAVTFMDRPKIFLCLLAAAVLAPAGLFAQGREKRLYELYNSTATPVQYKRILERRIERAETRKRALSRRFKLGSVYSYPNPAMGVKHPVIHVEAGLADKVEIKIYAPDGSLAEETVLTDPPKPIRGVYAYEYRFASENTPYGTCSYTVKAFKNGAAPLEASGRMFFLRTGYSPK